MNLRTTGLGVALFLGLAAAACFSPPEDSNGNGPTPTPTPVTEIKITYPVTGGVVNQAGEVVRGTSKDVPAGQKLWVVVFVHEVSRYYPQNNPAKLNADGTWDSPTAFGVAKDSGDKFDALAVTVDARAEAEFRSYLQTARDKNDYPGFELLPDGALTRDTVTVTRK
jgi:hypothetical protein